MNTSAASNITGSLVPDTAPAGDVITDRPMTVTLADDLFVHPHWLQFRDVMNTAPSWFLTAVGVYITIICLAGLIGNCTVIIIFIR